MSSTCPAQAIKQVLQAFKVVESGGPHPAQAFKCKYLNSLIVESWLKGSKLGAKSN